MLTQITGVKKWPTRSQALRAKMLRRALKNTGDWRCHLCGGTLTISTATIDHIQSLADGGSKRGTNNVKLAHGKCNVVRGTEPVHFFKMKMHLTVMYPCVEAHHNERISRKRSSIGTHDFSSQR